MRTLLRHPLRRIRAAYVVSMVTLALSCRADPSRAGEVVSVEIITDVPRTSLDDAEPPLQDVDPSGTDVPEEGDVQPDVTVPEDSVEPADASQSETSPEVLPIEDAAETPDTGVGPVCPAGVVCVSSFPFEATGNTLTDGELGIDTYDCKLTADESGPEVVYRVDVPEAGFLSAAVFDDAAVDVDVHILSDLDGGACLGRGDLHAAADVPAGVYFVVVDSYVSAGQVKAGPYTLEIGLLVPSSGPCAMETGIMERVGDGGDHLAMPATGPMVLEAHLVTAAEPAPFPTTPTDELLEHFALSRDATGLVMHRTQDWAPLEGGDFYGAGIGRPNLLPLVDEGWYVNMYWTPASRPPRGTRMILRLPGSTRAVVVSAGHETGPGNLSRVGGTPEETHFYLGTGHLDPMTLGIAVDQSLGFGPRTCTD